MALFTLKKSRMPKTTIKELLALMKRKKPIFLCLSVFPRLEQQKNQVKGAKIPKATKSAIKGANILSKGEKPNAGFTAET